MVGIPGVIDAYFEEEIVISVAAPGTLDEERLREVLTEAEIQFTRIEKAS